MAGVGGSRATPTRPSRWHAFVITAALLPALGACGDDDPATDGDVTPAGAYTAMVIWQADQHEPVLDDDGEEMLPVVYVVTADDDEIEVGVQAAVAEATADVAIVRFADQPGEAFDTNVDGEPVIDQGSMLSVGPLPSPAPVISVAVVRHLSADDVEPFDLEITATEPEGSDDVTATVTAATQP